MTSEEILKVLQKLAILRDESGNVAFPELCNCGSYTISSEIINSQKEFEKSALFWKYNENNELPEDPLDSKNLPVTWQDILDHYEGVQIDTYRENRRSEYPSLEEQLDYIYHNGIDAWKTNIIDPIKEKYPKP